MPLTDLKNDALSFCLHGAARAIAKVGRGAALPQALAQVFAGAAAPVQARGAIQDIAYRAMRRRGLADTLILALAKRKPEQDVLHGLLICALALLAAEDAPYEAFTVVDQAVSAAAADPALMHAKGMVNAVLRRFLREREDLLRQALLAPQAAWNYPVWWIEAVKQAYPQDWQAILQTGNALPPLTLRVNRRKTTVSAYLDELSGKEIEASHIGPSAVRLAHPIPVERIPGFEEGWVSVQDAAAQLAAPLLDLQDGMRVLDACAAPGGKSGHILECADVDLTALDADGLRLARVEQNLQRLGLQARLAKGDASLTEWWDGRTFDRILADVPCTASGIVRRHPDIRWLRHKNDAAKLATLSARILDNLWQMLRPDGKLLFVTCSLWPQESEEQAAAFAARHRHALRLPAPGQLLPVRGTAEDHDGLFYALFRKQPV